MSEDILKLHKIKRTKARIAIVNILGESSSPLSLEEIKEKSSEPYDLSTLYRTLNYFVEKGVARVEISPEKKSLYSLNDDKDQHVLVCSVCHKRQPIEGCPYEEANAELEEKTGFILRDHNVEIYGICPDCQHKEHK